MQDSCVVLFITDVHAVAIILLVFELLEFFIKFIVGI